MRKTQRKTAKKFVARRGYVKRQYRKRYGPLQSRNIHRFTRWEDQNNPVTISCNFGALGTSLGSHVFQLDKLSNYSDFVNLYDSYKITGVKVFFDYSADNTVATNPMGVMLPKLWVKVDHDDNNVPTLTELTESKKSRCFRFTDSKLTHSMYVKPSTLAPLYKGGVTWGYGPKYRQWIDTANADVPHLCIKLGTQGVPNANLGKITVRCKYYLTMKDVQ